ncbi:MAG TPA: hypothetical protein VFI63_03465 [Solirubrobacterales bacterium]|nr:hypothetical protein [Solirubrobacterales bacterium]
MYARVTTLEVDTVRIGVDDALARYREQFVPRLAAQEGYEGVLVFSTPEGKGLVITLWDSEEAALAGTEDESGLYTEVIRSFMTVFRASPGRDHYELAYTDLSSLPTG